MYARSDDDDAVFHVRLVWWWTIYARWIGLVLYFKFYSQQESIYMSPICVLYRQNNLLQVHP